MTRARRAAIVRRTRLYLATLIEVVHTHADGLYEGCESDEECALAKSTALRLAEEIRARTGRPSSPTPEPR